MFIPIGDDIQKRHFPAIGVLLIVANVLVYVHTAKLWEESLPKEITRKTLQEWDITKTPWYNFSMHWGLVPSELAKGKTIGLATYMFLHGDFFHLLGNMLVLWAFVGTLENSLGPGKFAFFYLLWGLFAGAAHAAFLWGDKLPMIGASGAVAGMIGGYFVLFGALSRVRTLVFLPRPVKIDIPAGLYVMIWLALQFAGMEQEAKSPGAHVAYYAHLGGAAIGALTMYFFRAKIHSQLKLNQDGVLEFKEEPRPREYSAAPGENGTAITAAEPPLPKACPHCGATMQDSHKIAERLWRCPTPSCQRLVY